jgi:hypothetical protein
MSTLLFKVGDEELSEAVCWDSLSQSHGQYNNTTRLFDVRRNQALDQGNIVLAGLAINPVNKLEVGRNMIDGFLELTWRIAKRQVCDVRSTNPQRESVGKAELRFVPNKLFMIQPQEMTSRLVGI